MKHYIFYIILLVTIQVPAQSITLRQCIESGLQNKGNIQSAKIETIIANLKSIETKAKFLPQLNIAYEYRYNPIIASQFVPIGQFSPSPTDEKRAIQFGTRWQQNAGVTIYQPLVDKAIKSRLAESKLNEKLVGVELKKVEENLIFEIVQLYTKILIAQNTIEEKINDTARSFLTFSLIKTKWEEGKLLNTELNDAKVNHLANINSYKKAVTDLLDEKIYLHFLTNIQLEKILENKFDAIPNTIYGLYQNNPTIQTDSLTDFKLLVTKEQLIRQQIYTVKTKYVPTVGIQGFLGGNQFSNTFNPVMNNSWFGNSYVGLSIKLPLFTPDQSVNADKQLQQQINIISFQKKELQDEKNKEYLQLRNKVEQYKNEQEYLQSAISLKKDNISTYQYQLKNGQYSIADINVKEADLQTTISQLKTINEKLNLTLIELLRICGSLNKTILYLLP